ncbi:MAG: proline--tRNA ligase [Gallicola sp.]|nr:proline--tRNA ligase [Gallicola sp.]
MRMNKMYLPTLREDPADADIASHRLMLRAGMIRQMASGMYSYLPLGYRVIQKVEEIVREEMDNFGAQEVLMPILQPKEIWDESGRWETFGPEMFKIKDRHNRDFCLTPTAEEYFTTLIKGEIKSYKQLPLNIYQIQTKFRDEKRPRFGINRAREFYMKDGYSFDTNRESHLEAYDNMWRAYEAVFDRLGLDYKIVAGDTGAMGGSGSHEFIALSEVGEGVICYSESGKYAATDERAPVTYNIDESKVEAAEISKVHTPNCKTIEEVSAFLGVDPSHCFKAIDLMVEGEPVLAIIPGNRELNMAKLISYLKAPEHEIVMMEDEDIVSKVGSVPGYTGPKGLSEGVRVLLDKRITQMKNGVIGANANEYHYINANYGIDFEGEVVEDLLLVEEGDIDEETGEALQFARGIEVGNIFQLGTKYSEAIKATYLDEQGKEQLFYMGSYGIGISRSVAAIIEQNYDEKGIIWPLSVAPYQVIITVVNTKKEDQMEAAEKIYEKLLFNGVEVIIDDRKERAGVKFNDRDLIGIPLRITVGKGAADGLVEFSTRSEGVNEEISVEEAVQKVQNIVDEYNASRFSDGMRTRIAEELEQE